MWRQFPFILPIIFVGFFVGILFSCDQKEKAGDLVLSHQYVSLHVPAFGVRTDNLKNIQVVEDLLKPEVKIAVGNKKMCAIGRISEEMLKTTAIQEQFTENISITGSTANELLELVLHGEVDASLIWRDMMRWPDRG